MLLTRGGMHAYTRTHTHTHTHAHTHTYRNRDRETERDTESPVIVTTYPMSASNHVIINSLPLSQCLLQSLLYLSRTLTLELRRPSPNLVVLLLQMGSRRSKDQRPKALDYNTDTPPPNTHQRESGRWAADEGLQGLESQILLCSTDTKPGSG